MYNTISRITIKQLSVAHREV